MTAAAGSDDDDDVCYCYQRRHGYTVAFVNDAVSRKRDSSRVFRPKLVLLVVADVPTKAYFVVAAVDDEVLAIASNVLTDVFHIEVEGVEEVVFADGR